MTTTEQRIAAPERLAGQGLDPNQDESGNRAIIALLTDRTRGPQNDLVITYRHDGNGEGAYEVWAERGMVRFQRLLAGEGYEYRIVEQAGENPVERQDPTALATLGDELAAGAASGHSGDDPAHAFVEPEHVTYPRAYERIAQLFDSPEAPDIVLSPRSYAFGRQPGQHGTLDVVQSRAPLVLSGPGVKAGVTDLVPAQVDIAPTLAMLLSLPLIDGKDATGRTSSQREAKPDVYLKRQDGRPIGDIIDGDGRRPERAYILLLDGVSNSELQERLERDGDSIPNLRRLIEGGVTFRYGTMVNFPTITWPSHNTLGTGAWCGHHDVVNPAYYLRATRETIAPQAAQFDTAKHLSDDAETLFEAVHRVRGTWDGRRGAVTASINEPCARGALHSTLEHRMLTDARRLRELTGAYLDHTSPRWRRDGFDGVHRYSRVDNQGLAQALLLFDDEDRPPPTLAYQEFALPDAVGHDYGPHHEAMLAALVETDGRIGEILSLLERRGLLESTLFVITADHGMAPIDTELAANQVQAVLDAGLKAVVPAPMVYLLDMDVTVEPSADGRSVTVIVLENDADARGEQPPVEGAEVKVLGERLRQAQPERGVLAEAKTDGFGVAGLPLPVDADPAKLIVSVRSDRFNPRHVRLDGTSVVDDPRQRLYGSR